MNVLAAIFDFNGIKGLERVKIYTKGAANGQEQREGWGQGSEDYLKEVPDGFEFLLTEHIKQSRSSQKVPSVVLRAFPADSSLCVVTSLREYLKHTKPLKGSESKFFISGIKPYKQVSRETIARWICSVMEDAGLDTKAFKPHSTRAAATSNAKAACVPIHDILRHAGWSSSRCFDLYLQ